jgi:glycerophosphoryl diester phosphodiesterase
MITVLINAHRGDPIQYRENTMPAFASAVGLGADCIEMDIRCSLDTQAVVLHDETLNRLWGIARSIASMTYDDIFRLTKSSDLYIPRLEEVLGTFDVPIMIDFDDETAVQPILRTLADYPAAAGRCIISSGQVPALMAIRSELKHVSIALTWNDIIPPHDSLLQSLDVQYFNPNYRVYEDDFVAQMSRSLQTAEPDVYSSLIEDGLEQRARHPEWYAFDEICGSHLVAQMHERHRKVSAWTVDDAAVMTTMLQLGVDLVTTNDTRTLMEVRNGTYSE